MNLINTPFDETAFSKQTKVLLDACILLALMDGNDIMNNSCDLEITKLNNQDSQFYVSNVVLSEVINKTLSKLFINDMQFIFNNLTPLNSTNKMKQIFSTLNNKDFNSLTNINSTQNEIKNIPYMKYFNKINKGKTCINRDVLQVYFTETFRLLEILEKDYKFKTLVINENMMNIARNYTEKYMIGINDSQHLATAVSYRMDYIMSTDGDFKLITENPKVKLLKVS